MIGAEKPSTNRHNANRTSRKRGRRRTTGPRAFVALGTSSRPTGKCSTRFKKEIREEHIREMEKEVEREMWRE